jgi:hypothetical protein
MLKVYLAHLEDFRGYSRTKIFKDVLEQSELKQYIEKNDMVAIKMHFGEKGNLAYVHPQYIKVLVEFISDLGGKPFLTDTNTLNGTWRLNSVDHIRTAVRNGFDMSVVDAPIIIADGIKGNSCKWIKSGGQNYAIGMELARADKIVYVSNFKGHQIGGFGGALKNLGVGSAAKIGKMDIHYKFDPIIDKQKCIGCRACHKICKYGAISDVSGQIDTQKCTRCCMCIEVCESEAITLYHQCDWQDVQIRYIQYAKAIKAIKNEGIYFLNVMENITHTCGCWGFSDSYMVADIGFAASKDPVALDTCCYDLVNDSMFVSSTSLLDCVPGEDKFKKIYPDVDATFQLHYAQQLGIGSLQYVVERVKGYKMPINKILEAK